MTRRTMLAACAGAVPAVLRAGTGEGAKSSLGVVIHSFAIRNAGARGSDNKPKFADPLVFLQYCQTLGLSAVQLEIGKRDDAYADNLRARAEASSIALEGVISLPRTETDVARFEAEIRTAKRAGATIVRTVMFTGRRYENFDSLAAFRQAAERATNALSLASRVAVRHGIRLAVENHKDWRAEELIGVLKRLNCDHVGVCLDTGNSIALLEDPIEVVESLAPFALTTHIKDMAVEEYADGFLLAEVPFGTGMVDLPRVVQILRVARPEIRFIIEMITRDPLRVPCLTDRYWATFPTLPARTLARHLAMVRKHPPSSPLPRLSALPYADQLRTEDANMRRCIDYARAKLGT
jgi:3-oxoisoapionate decarboxylase